VPQTPLTKAAQTPMNVESTSNDQKNDSFLWGSFMVRSRLTLLLSRRACMVPCTGPCTSDFFNPGFYHGLTKADLRISIKDYRRNRSLRQAFKIVFHAV
jgi:hypothetical protein